MALIKRNKLFRENKERNTIHESVNSSYTAFVKNNDKYIQFDTYGRDSRQLKNKISQSFQLDKESAIFLYDLIKKEYNL